MQYTVTGDLRIAFSVDVEADSIEEAEEMVVAMSAREVEAEGNTDWHTAAVEIDGVHPDVNVATGEKDEDSDEAS